MAQEIGSAKAIHGHVTAAGPSGSRDLSLGSPVFKGDMIATDKGSAGSIQFLDKTVLNVGEGSKVSLDQYVYDASKGSGQVLFKMAQGTFRAVTGEIVKHNPESFKMQSPLATIGIRGTETGHVVNEGAESHMVMIFDGKAVMVQPLGGGAYQVLPQAGVKVEVGKFGAGPVVVMTPQEYKYFQSLTTAGVQQGAPTDTLSPQTQGRDAKVQAAQAAATKATAEAQAKAAAEAVAKAAAAAAAKAAADAAASGNPEAKAAADAAAKAAADAAAKAAIEAKAAAEAAAKAQMEAFAAQQATALADAAAKAAAEAAAKAAADTLAQTQTMTLDPGSIISFTTTPQGTVTITVTTSTGTTTTTTAPVVVSSQAQDQANAQHQTDDPLTNYTPPDITPSNSLDFSSSPAGVHVFLDSGYYYTASDPNHSISIASSVVNINGSTHDDLIYGNDSANAISGNDGNDTIYGMGGNDSIYGGDGNDFIEGGTGTNYLAGGAGNDTIIGGPSGDIIDTGLGLDSVCAGGGNDAIFVGTDLNGQDTSGNTIYDTIDGGAGVDTLYVTDRDDGHGIDLSHVTGIENIVLGDANTSITFPTNYAWNSVEGGVMTIDARALSSAHSLHFDGNGTSGAFSVMGGEGNDSIIGGAGNDTIEGMLGNDTLAGGSGTDTLSYAHATAGVTVNLQHGTVSGGEGNDTVSGFANVIGSNFADTITAHADGGVLTGGAGADTLIGGAGHDTFVYNAQSDVATGETITATASDTLQATASIDFRGVSGIKDFGTIELTGDGLHVIFDRAQLLEQDTITFEHGDAHTADTLSVYMDTGNTTVDASSASITGAMDDDTLQIFGSTAADTITGASSVSNYIAGNAGDDVLTGGYASDTLEGGAGNDTLDGGGGNNVISGGDGNDYIIGNGGNATIAGGDGTDTLSYASLQYDDGQTVHPDLTITAGATAGTGTVDFSVTIHGDMTIINDYEQSYTGIESLIGGGGNDTFIGSAGADVFDGGGGNDSITGGQGNDTLSGGYGNNTIDGGAGADHLYGAGGGTNTFIFNTGDVAAGETLTFANGNTDILQVKSSTDFSNLDSISIEGSQSTDKIFLDGDGVSATFNAATLAHSPTITWELIGSTGIQTLTLNGTSAADTIDLSGMTLTNWTSGKDSIVINGGAGADTITGSSGDDVIRGGAGADVIHGGAGTNLLDYSQDTGGYATAIDDNSGTYTIIDGSGAHDTVDHISGLILHNADSTFNSAANSELSDASLAALTGSSSGTFSIDGSHLTASHTLTVNGSGVSDFSLVLTGGAGADVIHGGGADDTLTGGAGNDTLDGATGDNTLDYSSETGGAAIHIVGGDHITITDTFGSTDTIGDGTYGHANTITLNDVSYTGADKMTLTDSIVTGLQDPDVQFFTIDGSHLTAGHGLYVDASGVNAHALNIVGGAGDDTFLVSPNADVPADHFTGGAGFDTLDYTPFAGHIAFNYDSSAFIRCDGNADDFVTGIEKVVLNAADYTGSNALTVTDSFMNLMFGAGESTFTVDATHVDDDPNVSGSAYGVEIDGSGLSAGHDLIVISGPGSDTITGGSDGGHTIVSYENATDDLNVNLDAQNSTHVETYLGGDDTLVYVNGVITGSGNDNIQAADGGNYYLDGGAGNDTITGGDGADMIYGHSGTNYVEGRSGDDTLFGGQGDNTLDGGDGSDTVDYSGAEYAVTVNLNDGYAHVWNGTATIFSDVLSSIENIVGSSHDDTLFGDGNANVINGGAGNDTIVGNGGEDTLFGGAGSDVFHFNSDSNEVHIADFVHGTDTIQLDISQSSAFSAMSNGWTFTTVSDGSSHFGTTDKACLIYDTSDHTLYYDADGASGNDGVAVAQFTNNATITQADIHTTTTTPTGH